MKNDNYFVVQGFMHKKLGLSGNDLIVYAIIYGFSQDGESLYRGGTKYITDNAGISKRAVYDVFSRLVDKGLIERVETVVNGIKFVNYKAKLPLPDDAKSALPHAESAQPYANSAQDPMQNLHNPMQNLHTENNNINNIYNINNNINKIKETKLSITHTEGIRNPEFIKEMEVSPVGDVLRGRRVGVNDLPRPTKKTVPEDYGLVKFDLAEIQVGDYERLLNWFEYHHREKATGKVLRPYCEKVFKQNVDLIKTLSNECWYYAVDCIEGAVNLGYQGFGKSDGFFYKAISLEDYEDDLKIIKGFRIYPEALPERFARYRPLVYDMAEKYFVDWIANHPDLDNTESEQKLAEIRAVKKGWTS